MGPWKNQERFTTKEIYDQVEKRAVEAAKAMGEHGVTADERPGHRAGDRPFPEAAQRGPERGGPACLPGEE